MLLPASSMPLVSPVSSPPAPPPRSPLTLLDFLAQGPDPIKLSLVMHFISTGNPVLPLAASLEHRLSHINVLVIWPLPAPPGQQSGDLGTVIWATTRMHIT